MNEKRKLSWDAQALLFAVCIAGMGIYTFFVSTDIFIRMNGILLIILAIVILNISNKSEMKDVEYYGS
jgi:hypothetical protein